MWRAATATMPTLRKVLINKSRGFTLIEMGVVVLVVVLMVATVVPKLASFQRGIDSKISMDQVQRLASRAREIAMSTGQPVTLAFESTENRFELRSTTEDGDSQVLASAALAADIVPQRFLAGENEPSSADWSINFYSDSTSDGGGVEVVEGGITRSLVIGAKSGLSRWQDGGMPANELDRWPAGEYERRG